MPTRNTVTKPRPRSIPAPSFTCTVPPMASAGNRSPDSTRDPAAGTRRALSSGIRPFPATRYLPAIGPTVRTPLSAAGRYAGWNPTICGSGTSRPLSCSPMPGIGPRSQLPRNNHRSTTMAPTCFAMPKPTASTSCWPRRSGTGSHDPKPAGSVPPASMSVSRSAATAKLLNGWASGRHFCRQGRRGVSIRASPGRCPTRSGWGMNCGFITPVPTATTTAFSTRRPLENICRASAAPCCDWMDLSPPMPATTAAS